MRLTNKTSVEFTPECSKVNPLTTQGKCPYYEKLAEFEDFMEEQGFEDLEHLKLRLENLQHIAKYYARWEELKEYVKEELEKNKDLACTAWYNADEEFLAKMKELEK